MSNIRDLKKNITTMKACKWTHSDVTGSNPSHADSSNPQRHTRDGKGMQNNRNNRQTSWQDCVLNNDGLNGKRISSPNKKIQTKWT